MLVRLTPSTKTPRACIPACPHDAVCRTTCDVIKISSPLDSTRLSLREGDAAHADGPDILCDDDDDDDGDDDGDDDDEKHDDKYDDASSSSSQSSS